MKQKLLISVRGRNEAMEAYKGGAHIADVEFPASALGTPYPLNIMTVRKALPRKMLVSTDIGERQLNRSTACQAALGVAYSGADIIKVGLANLKYEDACYLGGNIVRTVKYWFPRKQVIPAIFADTKLRKIFNPIKDGPKLAKEIKADGILIDTFDKECGKGLLNYLTLEDIERFISRCHKNKIEAWIAGSITKEQLPNLWRTGVDVICIRGAACEQKRKGRFGDIKANIVRELLNVMKEDENDSR